MPEDATPAPRAPRVWVHAVAVLVVVRCAEQEELWALEQTLRWAQWQDQAIPQERSQDGVCAVTGCCVRVRDDGPRGDVPNDAR